VEKHLIAAAVQSRSSYETLAARRYEDDLSPSGQILFEVIGKYYATDTSAQEADIVLLSEALKQSYPKHAGQLSSVLSDLPDSSNANAVSLWLASKRQLVGSKLATALSDNRDDESIKSLMEEYEFYKTYSENEVQRTFQGHSADELLAQERSEGLIPFYPRIINDAIGGGADRGSHIVVFGRPNYGKTQLLINAVAVMLHKGFRVLYCCNEEPPKKLLLRMISRLCDMDIEQVRADSVRCFNLAVERGYNNLIVHQMIPGTIYEVDAETNKIRPDVVIVDQLRNLQMKGCEGLTQVLEKGGQHMRNIASKYNVLAVSVTQAGESAHNKISLDYNDIEYSNTGLAATADLMIGVGRDERLYQESKLVLSICKNKMTDVHGQFPVRVNRQRSKIRGDI
jgi:archaellum biogenesis ATPase FlaH